MRIDAHQHFWTLARGDYRWLTPELGVIHRDFGPPDLAPHLERHHVDKTVLVQAADSVVETRFLLEVAARTPFVGGVVGWIDFEERDAVTVLSKLAANDRLRGVRPMIQDIADPDWMLRGSLAPIFHCLPQLELSFDALVLPKHLPNLRTLLARHPDLAVVIDHGAKPAIRDRAFESWAKDIASIAADTRALCKISGLVTEAKPDWRIDDLRPYVDHLIECFGPTRLMWGSDWPVLNLAGDYSRWVAATDTLLEGLAPADRREILGDTASRFYRIA